MNDRFTSDNERDYPVYETMFTPQYPTFTDMITGKESYSFTSGYPSPPYSTGVGFFDLSTAIPRTCFPTSEGQGSPLSVPVDPPALTLQPPFQFPQGPFTDDYRSSPSASPTTPIGGFEGMESITTHENHNLTADSLSAGSSVQGSRYSTPECYTEGYPENMWEPPQSQPYWGIQSEHVGCETKYINPSQLTNPSQVEVDQPTSIISSPQASPISPNPASSSPSPSPTRIMSRPSKSPRLENTDQRIRVKSPSSPSGQQSSAGRDAVCPECGKTFRDMKAHTLTHRLERPEKCPIATCEYSKKGFARKYDCQRHTLTHYKGTMVCGFCPCAGSPSEKSFNRADVFKRHLLSVHQVEQTPHPKKQPVPERYGDFEGAGKCSTCLKTFSTAQQLYEHLDDCVFRKVVEEEPGAAHNVNNMNQVELEAIKCLLESPPSKGGRRPGRSSTKGNIEGVEGYGTQEPGDTEEGTESIDAKGETTSKIKSKKRPSGPYCKRNGVNVIEGLGPLRRPNKKRKMKNFPAGWGCSAEQMVIKRRLVNVYYGSKLLCSDEMVMNTELEVRAPMGEDSYVSDLDFWTMQKAHAALDAGPANVDVR